MTQTLFLSQVRFILATLIGYAAGKGWLTPADAGLASQILAPLGAIFGPWIWTLYANINSKLVPKNSIAVKTNLGEDLALQSGDPILLAIPSVNKPDGMVYIASTVVGALLLGFIILAPSSGHAATAQGACNIQTIFVGLTPLNFATRLAACGSADFQSALDDANTAPVDNMAIACLQPAVQVIKALEAQSAGTGGLATAFQKFRRAKQSGFVVSCIAYVQSTISLQ
jgi:hypothetical protein